MIYLDYSATTPVNTEVLKTFNDICINYPGNSNSIHSLGVKSKCQEELSTSKIAELLNVLDQLSHLLWYLQSLFQTPVYLNSSVVQW